MIDCNVCVDININANAAAVLVASGNAQGAWDLLSQDPLSHEQRREISKLFAAIRKKSSHCCGEIALLSQVLRGQACSYHCYGTSKNYLAVPSSPLGFQVERVSIEFSNGLSGNDLDFEAKEVDIQCYLNYNELRFSFNFLKNGFEYCQFQGPLLVSISNLSAQPFDPYCRLDLGLGMIDYLTQWGKKNEIAFDRVGLLGFFYRNSDPNGDGSKPAFFAHVDFKESDMKKNLVAFKNEWKSNLDQTLGPMTEAEYSCLNITQIVNLWLPFNETLTTNTLAVMDLSSVESPARQLDDYVTLTPTHAAEFTTMIVQPNPKQKWVAHPSMSLGQGILFNSLKTPHVSVNTWNFLEPLSSRRVEGRFAFIKS